MVATTYGKKKPTKLDQSALGQQPMPAPSKLSDRVQSAIDSVESRLKRLSMTVKETQSALKQKHHLRRMSFVRAVDGTPTHRLAPIGLVDLEGLQTGPSAQSSFGSWLGAKLKDGWEFEKIAESTFSEVFRGAARTGQKMVLKVMPLVLPGGCIDESKDSTPIPVTLEAAFHEVSALFAIQDRISKVNRYAVPSSWTGFANLLEYHCGVLMCVRFAIVDGPFPEPLLAAWTKWKRDNPGDCCNVAPSEIASTKFAILCMEDGGQSLEDCCDALTAEQLVSVVKQMIIAVSVLERELSFEHRDLHMGNVLVKDCGFDHIEIPGCPLTKTEGVQCFLIDCSISRFSRDLEVHEWIFQGDASVDPQYEVYREMRRLVNNDWSAFNPRTNLMWVKHVVQSVLRKQPKKKTTRQCSVLEGLDKRILEYPDLRSLVKQDELFGKNKSISC